MNLEKFVPIDQLCRHYHVEMSFFTTLNDIGLIQIETIQQSHYVHQNKASDIEKIIRIHQELDINFEGIDTIFNLLEKIESLQMELVTVKNRLRLYEDE